MARDRRTTAEKLGTALNRIQRMFTCISRESFSSNAQFGNVPNDGQSKLKAGRMMKQPSNRRLRLAPKQYIG
jgi:hypothetical protein